MNKRNRVRCNKCNTIVESKHRHDFRWCTCGHVAVDGGPAYDRRVWNGTIDWVNVVVDENGEDKFVKPLFN